MTNQNDDICNDGLLSRYVDGDLSAEETACMESHLDRCQRCQTQVTHMRDYSHVLRDRIRQATETVDFVALEKQVLNKAIREYRYGSRPEGFISSLKYAVPATLVASMLLFFAYSHYMSKPASAPSAIINSFTGEMSSVMIFETPEKRQTILWYNEKADVESEQDAV